VSLCVVTHEQCSCDPSEGRPCHAVEALKSELDYLRRVENAAVLYVGDDEADSECVGLYPALINAVRSKP
jgi:hypothetical protein